MRSDLTPDSHVRYSILSIHALLPFLTLLHDHGVYLFVSNTICLLLAPGTVSVYEWLR